MTNDVRLKARQILTSVAAMVRDHRLVRGMYVQKGDNLPTLPAAPLCNGYEACAIGALYMSAGVKPRMIQDFWGGGEYLGLPGVDSTDAYVARSRNAALKVAYAALNAAAERELARRKGEWDPEDREYSGFDSAVEFLFEETLIDDAGMLKVVNRARASLRPA